MFGFRRIGFSALMIAGACTAGAAVAQEYPSRSVKIIVPYQPGGSTDSVVRKMAELMSPKLGQPVIIENKGGAGATLGAREIAQAAPDGYTLAIIPSPVFRMPHIQKQGVGYDPTKDFTYIAMLSGYTLGVAVPAQSPYKTWQDLVAAARAEPDKITYGTASIGSASNVMMEQTATHLGIRWRHIPYKGENEVLQNVLGGSTDVYAGSSTVVPMVKSGRMRMLVTWGAQRSAIFPGTPTLNELEPGLAPAYAPFGIAGPKGLSPQVTQRLSALLKDIVQSPQFKDILAQYGQEPVYLDGAAYEKYALEQFKEEAKIVKQLGLDNR